MNGSANGREHNGIGGYVKGNGYVNGSGRQLDGVGNGYGANRPTNGVGNGYGANRPTNGVADGYSRGAGPGAGAPPNGTARAVVGIPVNGNARTVNGGALRDYHPSAGLPPSGDDLFPGVGGAGAPVTISAGMVARQIAPAPPGLSLAAWGGGRQPGDLPFDPMQDPATLLGDFDAPAPARPPTPPAGGGAGNTGSAGAAGSAGNAGAAGSAGGPAGPARPSRPGFDRSATPPSGSTVHQPLPQTPFRPRSPGQLPRGDGFDEWLESFAVEPAARPQRVVQPVRRLAGPDVTAGGRATIGGPQSAPPRLSNREADFFVLKPSAKKAKPVRQTTRRKFSAAVFLTILVLVVAAGAVAVLLIHSHPH